jgi:inner membrane protein
VDNLTHTLTGLALSRAGLNRFYGRAALVLMLAANAPDMDVAWSFRGTIGYLEHHRGITHSIPLLPVVALLPVLITCAVGRTMRGWKAAWVLSMIGVASHLLLDSTNAYGIRLLLPFSARWFELDLNNIFDFWFWGILLLAWLGPALAKLVSSEIGSRAGSGLVVARFALCFLLLYDFGRFLAHQRAVEMLNSRVYQGGLPVRLAAFPASAANPLEWSGWVETPDVVIHFSLNLLTEFDPASGTTIYKPDHSAALDAARRTLTIEKFLHFARDPLWRVTPVAAPEGAQQVDVRDWRFPFTASALVDASNRVISSSFHF